MATDEDSSADQDWRLEAELDASVPSGRLHGLVGRFRGPDVVKDVEASVPHDVVVTHDGKLLFAYASEEATLKTARAAIEDALRNDGVGATVRISRWDDERDAWLQTDPPLSATEQSAADAAEKEGETIETRTMVATSGKLIRAEFEQSMLAWANKLGLECSIIEHPHLLSTQVGFTVTGEKHRIDEFARGLRAEGWAYVRADANTMLTPL